MRRSTQLDELLGAGPRTPIAITAFTPVESPTRTWMEAAGARTGWMLWGKAMPSDPTGCPAHPLLCHMADVAAVAALMITRTLPRALRRQLLRSGELDEERMLRFLLFVIALHDVGKAAPPFQRFAPWAPALLTERGFDFRMRDSAHHSALGVALGEGILGELGVPKSAERRWIRAVAAHHGEFPTDTAAKPGGCEDWDPRMFGVSPAWQSARAEIVGELRTLFGIDSVPTQDPGHAYFVLLAGLTSVADWIGSMTQHFSYVPPQPSLDAYWPHALARASEALAASGMRPRAAQHVRGFELLFPGYVPWPLHKAAENVARTIHCPALVVIEAPMGEGKTEASLLLAEAAARIGHEGLFIGLPTQATANQMFKRVRDFLERTGDSAGETLMLAHSEASLVDAFAHIRMSGIYSAPDRAGAAVRAESWFQNKKRALIADHAVGTIDQALLSVLRVPHGFVRCFGLAGKTVVLDEVHAYDTYTGTILENLVEWLGAMGATVVLLSATLPRERREALVSHYLKGTGVDDPPRAPDASYPRITVASGAGVRVDTFEPRKASVEVAIERSSNDIAGTAASVLDALRDGGCAGWVLNTVARAQAAFEAIRALDADVALLLIHARLLPGDRLAREQELERWLGPPRSGSRRPERCIVIGTQVLEQSLDVDFDVLFTDVAPIDLVLQRTGRLFRHDREDRSTAQSRPRVCLSVPTSDGGAEGLKEIAPVYARIFVELTLRALADRRSIRLPDEIDALVSQVYDAGIVPGSIETVPDDLRDAYVEQTGAAIGRAMHAERNVIPSSQIVDDIFSDLRVFLDDDDDPALHAQLRAATRLGDPTIDIVCLERRGDGVVVGGDDATEIDLNAEPDPELTKRLVLRSIGVSRPGVVRALLREPVPEGWKRSAVLRYRRPVVFENGRARAGGCELHLHPALGLVVP